MGLAAYSTAGKSAMSNETTGTIIEGRSQVGLACLATDSATFAW